MHSTSEFLIRQRPFSSPKRKPKKREEATFTQAEYARIRAICFPPKGVLAPPRPVPRRVLSPPPTPPRRPREPVDVPITFVHNGILRTLRSRRHALSDLRAPYATEDDDSAFFAERAYMSPHASPGALAPACPAAGVQSANAHRRPLRHFAAVNVANRRKQWCIASDEVDACMGHC